MKKVISATLMGISTLLMSAQTNVVKEAGNDLKSSNPDYVAIVNKLKPAMENPETANDVNTWFYAGKASIGNFDELYKRFKIGQEVSFPTMGNALMDGINYFLVALPLDSVPDAKGKIKAKNSKEMIKQIKENYSILAEMGDNLYNDKSYNDAYKAYDMYLNLPYNPVLGKNAPAAQPDSVLSLVAFNKGIASWQGDSLQNALSSFRQAIRLGYNQKHIYDYAIAVAANLNDKDAIIELATEAYPLYGHEDVKYLQCLINPKIEAKEYDEARDMLLEALQQQPDNGQIYFSLGTIEDIQENRDKAIEYYKKALELNPQLSIAKLYLGQALYNQAAVKDDEASQLSTSEYLQIKENEIKPLFNQAIPYLEAAYAEDSENLRSALNLLRTIYYNLEDATNLERIEQLLND